MLINADLQISDNSVTFLRQALINFASRYLKSI